MTVDIVTQRSARMWSSLETASSIFNWAHWFLLGALAVGVVSAGLVIWTGNVKEEYLRRDLSSARLGAADATERAVLAEQKAAEAKLSLEQPKAQRLLSPGQTDRFWSAY